MPHNEERRRRVLMVAYHFPPLGGGGVQRTAKYVKYMPSAGFDPVVVAGSAHAFVLHDEAAGRDIPPGTPVMRARALPLYRAQWMLDGLFRRLGLPRKLLNEVLWPDEFVGWLPAAVVQGMRMAKAYQPQVLYTTSLPATAHLAGMMLQRMTGLPWVADFRDAYTMNPLHTRGRGHVTGAASEALERAVAERASYVTFADETMHIKGLRGEDPRRVVITNGVDEDDLRELEHGTVKSGRFRLSYVGSLYGRHDGGPVFDAMRDLLREGAIDADSIEVRIVGHAAPESRSRLDGLPVTFTGYASHRQALECPSAGGERDPTQ